MKKQAMKQAGFTLVELVFALAATAILAGAAQLSGSGAHFVR